MDFTFGKRSLNRAAPNPPSSPFGGEGPQDSIGSDRLQKAIERNRAKQLKRERVAHTHSRPQPPPPPRPREGFGSGMSSSRVGTGKMGTSRPGFRSKFNQTRGTSNFESRMNTSSVREKTYNTSPSAGINSRRRPLFNSSQIQNKILEKLNNPLNRIKERTNVTINRTRSFVDAWSLRIGWMFCLFLLFRLIVSEGGLSDFYSKKQNYNSRETYKNKLQGENIGLIKEIDQIKNNSALQKKLVRKHLGYINPSEYLVLFSKESQ
ncbi:MAG: FtsB family cell division protein [Bacteriovoracaceae bacterium]